MDRLTDKVRTAPAGSCMDAVERIREFAGEANVALQDLREVLHANAGMVFPQTDDIDRGEAALNECVKSAHEWIDAAIDGAGQMNMAAETALEQEPQDRQTDG